MNYVQLVPGIPKRLHYTDDYEIYRTIADKETGKPKRIHGWVFWVDEEDGVDVAKTHSILSQKLFAHLEPFLPDKQYTRYDFIITKLGDGFLADFNFQPIFRPE